VGNFFSLEHYPRRLAVLLIVMALACIALPFVWLNAKGPIWHSVTSEKNEYVHNNNFVDHLPGHVRSNEATAELDYGHSLTQADLVDISKRTRRVMERLAKIEAIVISIANYPNMNGGDLKHYIPYYIEDLSEGEFDMNEWCKDVAKDTVAMEDLQLVSTDCTSVTMHVLVPALVNEVYAGHVLWDTFEEVDLTHWYQRWSRNLEWFFWKTDFNPPENPNGPKVYLYSWFGAGRPAIDAGLKVQIIQFFPLGLVLAALWIALSLRFLPQFFVPVIAMIVFSLVGTLAMLWPLGLFGMFLTVYASIPLAGTFAGSLSANLQKMSAFAEHNDIAAVFERWRATAKMIHFPIHTITLLTIGSFLICTWMFGSVWRMVEMGMLFMVGACFGWITSIFFLPAIHLFFINRWGAWTEEDLWPFLVRISGWFDAAFDRIGEALITWHEWVIQFRQRRLVISGVVVVLFLLAVFLYASDRIEVISRPFTFLPHRNVRAHAERANHFSHAGGKPLGYDPIQIYMGLKSARHEGELLASPEFLVALAKFQTVLKRGPMVTRVFSSGSLVLQRLHNDDDLGEHPEGTAFKRVVDGEKDIDPSGRLPSFLHTSRYVQILAYHPMEDSESLRAALAWVKEAAKAVKAETPDLDIRIAGEAPYFVELVDGIISQIPQDTYVSLPFIGIGYMLVFVFFGWRYGHDRRLNPFWVGWVLAQAFIVAISVDVIIMYFTGIPLNLATVPTVQISVEVAADLVVYLALEYARLLRTGSSPFEAVPLALKKKSRAVLDDCISNILCFVPLIPSFFLPISHIGILMVITLLVCATWVLFFTLPQLAPVVGIQEVRHGDDPLSEVVDGGRGSVAVQFS